MLSFKDGWKTTEFWVSLLTLLGGLLVALGVVEADDIARVAGFVAAVLAGLGYTAGRSYIKRD